MRATLGRVAVLVLLSLSVCGCKSGPSMFAWGKKKQDNLSEAPKYAGATGTNPTLPSSTVNPNGSLTNMPAPGSATGAAGSAALAGTAYGATPASYQNAYPKTPYEPGKLGAAPATTNWGTSGANPAATTYGAGAGTSNYANAAAATPAYSTAQNSAAPGVQPQTGFYPSSGASAAPATTTNSYAAAPTAASMTAPADSNGMMPGGYRTADARGVSPGMAQPAADPNAMQANANMGDRYSNPPAAVNGGYASPAASAPAASNAMNGLGDRYAQPPMNYRSDNSMPGSNGYQPGVTPNPPGNTGYNPADAYSTSGAAASGAASLPVRQDPNYRPGGTGNFTVPAGATLPANGGIQPSGHASFGGVTPASYQTPAATPADSGEMYGAYQGTSSSSEPAYGASNQYATQPGLLPTR